MARALRLAVYVAVVVIASEATSATNGATPQKKSDNALFKQTQQSKPLRILGLFPYNGFSHFQMSKALMLALAKKGHHVTVVSPFKLKKPVPNYSDIDLSEELPSLVNSFDFDYASRELSRNAVSEVIRSCVNLAGAGLCRHTFSHPKLQDIYAGKQKFDVIFTEIFATECFLVVGYKLKIPTIAVASSYNYPWTADYIGDVDNPAFFEGMFLPPSKDGLSTFWGRLVNTKIYVESKLTYYFYSTRPSEAVVREFFGEDVPSFAELKRNVSLVMVNSHDLLTGPKASVPRFLPVSGIHLQEPDLSTVPKEIATFLDSAPNGVLYFSLGSLVRSDSMPPRILNAIIGAFERLKPLRILWKYESSAEEAKKAGVPDNVMVAPWMPQMEILAHPNVKGFLTHGGLMGAFEALYNGVPMVGLPLFGDQKGNIQKFETLGIAVLMDHRTLDEDTVYEAVKKIVSDPEIQARAKELSSRFRDRPVPPADAAVWWTEYVVRHGGAPYLEAPTSAMPFYQVLLLDVIGAVILAVIVGIYLLSLLIKLSLRLFKSIFQRPRSSKKNN